MQKNIFEGTVVSDKPNQSIVVSVTRTVVHPKYHKRYTVSRRYLVHDPGNAHRVGQVVRFVACRPISARKRWQVLTDAAAKSAK